MNSDNYALLLPADITKNPTNGFLIVTEAHNL
jgi:hypothetical protein